MSNFRRRLMMSFEKKYTPVKYLESTGTQWIDTKYVGGSSTSIDMDIYWEGAGSTNYPCAFGATDSNGTGYNLSLYLYIVSTRKYRLDKFNVITNSFEYNNSPGRYHIVLNREKLYINDTLVSVINVTNYSCVANLALFARGKPNGNVENFVRGKIFSCSIHDNNNLVRDFIPVLDKDGVPCLYDKVEDKFYYNQGSGEFLYE